MGFPDELVVKKSACNAGDQGSIPGSEDSLEKREATPPVFLPRESYGQRSLVGYCPWGRRVRLSAHTTGHAMSVVAN